MGSVTAYEPSHPLKQRNTAEYGTREPYYRSDALRPSFLALVPLVVLACSRAEKPQERTEPWAAPSVAPSGSVSPVVRSAHYELEKADLTFELPAKHANPRGRLAAATGRFEIDLESLERSSGSVRVDLARIELDGAAADASATDPTRRALEWLELGSETPETERESRRFATFTFRGLEGAEGKSLSSLRERRDGKKPHLEATALGDLSLHGVRAPVRVTVSLEIERPPTPGAAPQSIVIRSRKPLVVSLGVHDIRPRDARGVLVARELPLLGESVGREAKLDFELTLALRP